MLLSTLLKHPFLLIAVQHYQESYELGKKIGEITATVMGIAIVVWVLMKLFRN